MSNQLVTASPKKIITLAGKQVGYHEGRSKNGWNNHQKYSPQVPGLEWSQNQAWCATFMSWLALKSGFPTLYPKSASCDAAAAWFKKKNRWSEYPAIGAQVFLGDSRDYFHTGLVVDFDAKYVYTIEGNTNKTGSSQGDGVYRMKRTRRSVGGYGLPKFTEGIVSADPARKNEAPAAKKAAAKKATVKKTTAKPPSTFDQAISATKHALALHPEAATDLNAALISLRAAKKAVA